MSLETKSRKRKALSSDPTSSLTGKANNTEKIHKAARVTKQEGGDVVERVSKSKISKSNGDKTATIAKERSKPMKTGDTKTKVIVTTNEDSDSEIEEQEEEDDQTAALLAGFSSSSEDENDDPSLLPPQNAPIPDIPSAATKALSKQSKAKFKSNVDGAEGERGVIVLSRVPHGFYEHQMRAYFSQFGDITNLRIARNRQTGASKHYAFIEFASAEVARIVAATMDNYLMFGHRLKVKMMDKEQVHPELWKGANKRFRPVPWNRIERTRLAQTDREGWEKRVKNESSRRNKKMEKLKKLGYDFEAPELKQVQDVPVVSEGHNSLEGADEAKMIEAAPAEKNTVDELIANAQDESAGKVIETVVTKKKKKRNDEAVDVTGEVRDVDGPKVSKSMRKKQKLVA